MLISVATLTSFRYSITVVLCCSWCYIGFHGWKHYSLIFPPYITPVARTNFVTTQIPEDLSRLERLFLPSFPEARVLPAKMASYLNLKELEIEDYSSAPVDLLWIASTIEALPLLSRLHVMLAPMSHRTREEVRATKTSGPPHDQLKDVLITVFVPLFYQTEMVICLLKKCVALQRMTIDLLRIMYSMDWELTRLKDVCVWKKEDEEHEQFYGKDEQFYEHTEKS